MGLPSTLPTPSQSSAAAAQPKQRALYLPPPQTFDILPALHELLARIEHNGPSTDASIPGLLADAPKASAGDIGALYVDQTPLEPKDLPAETLTIKARIRNALKALERLPDMERGVDEQMAEIEELEARIERQRAVLSRLGDVGRGVEGRLRG